MKTYFDKTVRIGIFTFALYVSYCSQMDIFLVSMANGFNSQKSQNVQSKSIEIEEIFNCIEYKSTSISWGRSGILWSKESLEVDVTQSISEPVSVIFVVGNEKTILKGNIAQVELLKISSTQYIEKTAAGHINLWTLLKGTQGRPTILYQQKAYALVGPSAFLIAFKCS